MTITIRKGTMRDMQTLQSLSQGLFDSEHRSGHDDVIDLTWPQQDKGKKFFQKALRSPHYATYFAQDEKGNVLGYIIGCAKNRFDFRTVKTGELVNVFVASDARRFGVGKKLFDTLQHWLKQKKLDRMYVSSYWKNKHAIGFYEAMGFRPWEMGLETVL